MKKRADRHCQKHHHKSYARQFPASDEEALCVNKKPRVTSKGPFIGELWLNFADGEKKKSSYDIMSMTYIGSYLSTGLKDLAEFKSGQSLALLSLLRALQQMDSWRSCRPPLRDPARAGTPTCGKAGSSGTSSSWCLWWTATFGLCFTKWVLLFFCLFAH